MSDYGDQDFDNDYYNDGCGQDDCDYDFDAHCQNDYPDSDVYEIGSENHGSDIEDDGYEGPDHEDDNQGYEKAHNDNDAIDDEQEHPQVYEENSDHQFEEYENQSSGHDHASSQNDDQSMYESDSEDSYAPRVRNMPFFINQFSRAQQLASVRHNLPPRIDRDSLERNRPVQVRENRPVQVRENQPIEVRENRRLEGFKGFQHPILWYFQKNQSFAIDKNSNQQIYKEDCPICCCSLSAQVNSEVKPEFNERMKIQSIQVTKLFCRHIFHTECIRKWLIKPNHQCPICRVDFRDHKNYSKMQEQIQKPRKIESRR